MSESLVNQFFQKNKIITKKILLTLFILFCSIWKYNSFIGIDQEALKNHFAVRNKKFYYANY
jgi:hypothetical protein